MSSSATFETRPASVSIFGILHLFFGGMGLLGGAFALISHFINDGSKNPFEPAWADHPLWRIWSIGGTAVSVVVTASLIVAGIGLLRMRAWARAVSIIYAIYSIVIGVVAGGVNFFALSSSNQLGNSGPMGFRFLVVVVILSSLIGLIYPIAVWYFLSRPAIVAAFDAANPAQHTHPWKEENAASEVVLPEASTNPFAAPQVATTIAPLVALPSASENVAHALIPTRNGAALTAYYLGLFSIIPILGLPLGVMAIVLGVKGLRRFREDASVRGRNHAWVGIICATLFGGFNLLLVSACVVGMIASFARR